MGKDFYFYKVSRIEQDIPHVIACDSEYKNDHTICITDAQNADTWMKANLEHFGCMIWCYVG